ncbi:N-acetylmuramoyl-L-alanine amidase [Ammonifex thiophilus]|uniref:Cell wall hydrolase n=1 Tax=Ammonifex thiophilus TaxID=444093 RepID=A0A3D8P2M0_9THEO|nr:N-acetylmuramoyl-L-alanine amidase [Ammonifex thiophilus]RDV82524.1 cell wall hydrolase [Ammonifex thiophilus]
MGRKPKSRLLLLLLLLLLLRGGDRSSLWQAMNWLYPVALVGRVIVVDPGHGGVDPGAHYQAKILEKDLVLSMGKMLAAFLEAGGAEVVMTRSEDRDLAPPDILSLSARKRYDLKERMELTRRVRADAYLSLHVNSSPDSSRRGVYIYYSSRAGSRELAALLAEEVKRTVSRRCFCLPGNQYYVLRENPTVAVLVEVGFISNPQERELLSDPAYQQRVAWALARGVYRFYAEQSTGGRGK